MKAQIIGTNGATKDVQGAFGDSLPVASIGGQYLEWLRKGYIFHGLVGTVAEIPKFDDTTNMPILWNPADSGKVVVPIAISVGTAAAATEVIHGLCLNYRANCGSGVATAAPFSVFTEVASVNMLLGSMKSPRSKWSPATNTATAAGTQLLTLGMGLWLEGTPAISSPYSGMVFKFDSILGMLPGVAVGICSNVASSTTFSTSIVYAELPYDPELWG